MSHPALDAPTPDAEPRGLAILGSTGSIGTQTLDVVRLFPDRFRVVALTCHSSIDTLVAQVREFRPEIVAVGDAAKRTAVAEKVSGMDVEVVAGTDGLCACAGREDVDVVMAAVVGFAGLHPVLTALKAGKTVALANKETMVVAGAIVNRLLDATDATLIPVDSEHSAIYQCLVGEEREDVEEIVLTASGGPFRARPKETFQDVTVEEALDHPNWSMGAKITIDSATMMNKGLEVIEAKWLFDLEPDEIQVLVHRQSIVHSMVAFRDGSIKAQLGVPDMKVPIQYALSHPRRWAAPHERLDWRDVARLDFETPDLDKFPCLRLAFDALRAGGTAPAVLNAANEVAVRHFLDEQIRFTDIPRAIEKAMAQLATPEPPSVDDLNEADAEARAFVQELVQPSIN